MIDTMLSPLESRKPLQHPLLQAALIEEADDELGPFLEGDLEELDLNAEPAFAA